MLGREPTTKRMNVTEVEGRLSSLVSKISREDTRILVEENGAPVAGIVPIEDMRRLARLDDQMREAHEVVEVMQAAFADVSDEEIERQTKRIMAEIKEENRAAHQRAVKSA
jgi:PHD/YefM family antitoxin component YafN of YafNO toxin-antitoxin module